MHLRNLLAKLDSLTSIPTNMDTIPSYQRTNEAQDDWITYLYRDDLLITLNDVDMKNLMQE